MKFSELGLPASLEVSLTKMGYDAPTPIQEQAIPIALKGGDIIGCAQTGTGKTAAFGIPLVTRLIRNPTETALVLVPTRELADQVASVLNQLTFNEHGVKVALLIGGISMFQQIRWLSQRPRIIVATPGRMADHLRRREHLLSSTRMLVLDEADRMLDMGFAPQLEEIRQYLPKGERQTMLFSATIPTDIQRMAAKWLKNPESITAGSNSKPVDRIVQASIETTQEAKREVLSAEIKKRQGSIIIFTRTKSRADRVARHLQREAQVCVLHGDRSQPQRREAIQGFRDGKYRILVATDIAARGLDIPHVAHVINYDLPMQAEDYVHRIGRTARAGADGESLCLITPDDTKMWREISRMMKLGPVASTDRERSAPRPASSMQHKPHRSPQGGRPSRHRQGGGGHGSSRPAHAGASRPAHGGSSRPAQGNSARPTPAAKPAEKKRSFFRGFGKSKG
ncbi:MAG: DEAD/DEAH box helicase [Bdellovibrionales bacterium]|nr:DEAD/DEAH box helicase [Bdellovibrionales bacterium]